MSDWSLHALSPPAWDHLSHQPGRDGGGEGGRARGLGLAGPTVAQERGTRLGSRTLTGSSDSLVPERTNEFK